jgi:hypothetical protein
MLGLRLRMPGSKLKLRLEISVVEVKDHWS